MNMEKNQHTLKKEVRIAGIGLHSGNRVTMRLKPGRENSGIVFVRTDISGQPSVRALVQNVTDTRLATTIGADGVSISTVEHLLAAFAGLAIDNAIVEIDGPEVPIMDGSAYPFVQILTRTGRKRQKAGRRMIRIIDEVVFADGDRSVRVTPCRNRRLTCEIDFPHKVIRQQSQTVTVSPETFAGEIAQARTFGFLEDIEALRQNGLALGGSLENAVVVDRFGVLNEEGLRFADEFVRHKTLDLLGDLSLFGCPIIGHVTAVKAGHQQHLGFLRELASHPEAWELIDMCLGDAKEVSATAVKAKGERSFPFLLPGTPVFVGKSCPI